MNPPRPGPIDPQAGGPPVNWRAVGLRRTSQREVVLGLVRSCLDHPTADWIHRQARRFVPDISLATVYRTLRLLKEKGLIHEFSGGASPSRFDGTLHNHEHVRCVRCGAVSDVDLPEVGDIRERVAERTGFRVGRYPLVFHGLCETCARANGGEPARSGNALFASRPGRERPSAENEDRPDGDLDRQLAEGLW
jgi:Fe2+ or Zn2+ uptake regulation protein